MDHSNHERDGVIILAMPQGLHPEDIKAAIRKKDSSLTSLALANGLCESACRAALRRSQPAAELVISKFLGVPLHKLWPDRYDRTGSRRASRHVRDENKRKRDAAHRQIVGAN